MSNINRRQFITHVGSAVGSSALLTRCASSAGSSGIVHFEHGVASGDPLQEQVIIWSRITPENGATPNSVDLSWQVATDSEFKNVVKTGKTKATLERDYTVKVDVTGLEPANLYFYRFIAGPEISPVGRTRTLPRGEVTSAELAVVSCSNFGQGYFNVYKEIANSDGLTAVLHLGDYLYEYDNETYQDPKLTGVDRAMVPVGELLALSDYRQRYGLYRRDPDLQKAHASHPFICVWDDHELANDCYLTGAENHQPDEGDWYQRKRAAIQAYREWMPIRDYQSDDDPEIIYRSFRIGDLAHLLMLDTRVCGRSQQLDYLKEMVWQQLPFDISQLTTTGQATALLSQEQLQATAADDIKMVTVPFDLSRQPPAPITDWARLQTLDPENLPKGLAYLPDVDAVKNRLLNDPKRQLLGVAQEAWLESELSDGEPAQWQLLAQQVLTGEVQMPDVRTILAPEQAMPQQIIDGMIMLGQLGLPYNTDAWDGYNACRQRYLNTLKHLAPNPISLAGDTHNAWAFELTPDGSSEPVAVEFATTSVTSQGMEGYLPHTNPQAMSQQILAKNRDLKYLNTYLRGWMKIALTRKACSCTFMYVSTVKSREYVAYSDATWLVNAGEHRLHKV